MFQRLLFLFPALLVSASLAAATPAAHPSKSKPATSHATAAATATVVTNQTYFEEATKLTAPIPAAVDASLSPSEQFETGIRLQYALNATADVDAALHWYEASAARGFAPAQAWSANFYRLGVGGAPIDKAKALGLYRAAAAQGWGFGYSGLGSMLIIGDGVPVDMAAGEKALRSAAGKDPLADMVIPVLDRVQRNPPCSDSFCAVLRLAVADAQLDFQWQTANQFNENHFADARYALPGATSCFMVDESDKELRQYVCIFKDAAAEPADLLPRIHHALDGGASHWVATDDSYNYTPAPNCQIDPEDPFSSCSPSNMPATHWHFKPVGYVDYYEFDFDYAKHRDAIPIANRISINVAPNPWSDGQGKMLQIFSVPHPGGPIEHHHNLVLYAYDNTTSQTYTIAIDGTVVGSMQGHSASGSNELALRVHGGSHRIRITDDATGYWEDFDVGVNAIFDHCFYDKDKGINCMSHIAHTIPPIAHR
jgi:hypothetical protein